MIMKKQKKQSKNFDVNLCEKAYQMNQSQLINFHKAQSYITLGVTPPAGKTRGKK
jgi:hypothetical protein